MLSLCETDMFLMFSWKGNASDPIEEFGRCLSIRQQAGVLLWMEEKQQRTLWRWMRRNEQLFLFSDKDVYNVILMLHKKKTDYENNVIAF